MKRKLLVFLLFLLSTGLTYADEVTIGTGSTKEKVPVYSAYGYTYSQTIYLQSELGEAGKITHLKWNFGGSTLNGSNDWTIYLGHTTESDFYYGDEWIPVENLTQVYSAVFNDPLTSGWIEFDIEDFQYDGVSNLVIAVDENNSEMDGYSDKFYTSYGYKRSIYKCNDYTNPDPTNPPYGSTLNYVPNIKVTFDYFTPYQGHDMTIKQTKVGGQGYFSPGQSENLIATALNSGIYEESDYTVEFYQVGSENDLLLGAVNQSSPLLSGETADVSLSTSFANMGEYQVYSKIIRSGDEVSENNTSDTITLFVVNEAIEEYTEDFEGGVIPGDWTVWNEDGDYKEWTIMSSSYSAHSGQYLCSVGYNSSGNDDWLVTPASLPVASANTFKFWAKSYSYSYPEDFEVWVSTTGNNPEDFSVMIASVDNASTNWTEYSYDLSDFIGQQVYLAIRCVSVDESKLYVDDVTYTPIPDISFYDLQANTITPADQIIEGVETAFTISITNNSDTDVEEYSISLYQLENSVETLLTTVNDPQSIASTQSINVDIPYTFSTAGSYSVFGKITYANDMNSDNDQNSPIDILVEQVDMPDLSATDISYPDFIAAAEATNFTINVQNLGNTDVDNYTIGLYKLEGDQSTELAITTVTETLAIDNSAEVIIGYTFETEGDYQLYAKVTSVDDINSDNDSTQIYTVNVSPVGSSQITVGTDETTMNIPVDMFYKSSLSESIYMAEELNGTGLIKSITYYTDFANDYSNQPLKIWLGETDRTELLEGDWIPSTELELVADTVIDWVAGEHQVTIILDQDYLYSGQNLVVMVERTTTNYKNYCVFKGSSTIYENRSVLYADDTDPANPASPATAEEDMCTANIPKTTFYVEEILPSSIEGIVNDGTNPIEGAQVQLLPAGTQVQTDDLGAFGFEDLFAGTYSVVVSAEGYYNDTIADFYLNSGETYELEVSLEAIPYIQIHGDVIGNNAPEGIEGASVTLSLGDVTYEETTNTFGEFYFVYVEGNNTYTLTIEKEGYQSYESQITCNEENLVLETISLVEILYPATELVVTDSVMFTALEWVEPQNSDRALNSYSVYRGLADAAFEDYTLLAEDITDENYMDQSWDDVENGGYKYAVTTIYDGGYSSDPVYSEIIEKGSLIWLVVAVDVNNGFQNSVDGVEIQLVNQDGNPEHIYNLSANDTVNCELIVANGIYDVYATHEDYQDYVAYNVEIDSNQLLLITLDELIHTPENLVAEDMTYGEAKLVWQMPATYSKGFMYFNLYLNGMFYGESIDATFVFNGLSYNTTYTFGVEAHYSSGDSEIISIEHAHMYDVAIENIESSLINVYPNPANASITIDAKNVEEVCFFNMHGQCVKTISKKENLHTIDISDLSIGTYVVRVIGTNKIRTAHFSIVR